MRVEHLLLVRLEGVELDASRPPSPGGQVHHARPGDRCRALRSPARRDRAPRGARACSSCRPGSARARRRARSAGPTPAPAPSGRSGRPSPSSPNLRIRGSRSFPQAWPAALSRSATLERPRAPVRSAERLGVAPQQQQELLDQGLLLARRSRHRRSKRAMPRRPCEVTCSAARRRSTGSVRRSTSPLDSRRASPRDTVLRGRSRVATTLGGAHPVGRPARRAGAGCRRCRSPRRRAPGPPPGSAPASSAGAAAPRAATRRRRR